MTLIELLVVVVIIGVLAATSVPSLLVQVGKAREAEAKSFLGALNRAQQVYYTEKAVFAGNGQLDNLEVPIANTNHYTFSVIDEGVQRAIGNDNANNGTRDYIGGVQYATDTRSYRGIICRSENSLAGYTLTNADIINAGVNLSSNVITCNSPNATEIR